MWAVTDGSGWACFLVIPFAIIWLAGMTHYQIFVHDIVPSAIKRWEKATGYTIVRQEQRTFFKGPFSWSSSNYPIIYRVNVADREGSTRWGWIRIGLYWWPAAGRAEVRWDEPADESLRPTRGNPRMWDRELDA